MVQGGVVSRVLSAKERYPGDSWLQLNACSTLYNLAFEDQSARAIVKAGAIPMILKDMSQAPCMVCNSSESHQVQRCVEGG